MPDYYKILGVEREATEEDIKRAYKRLAMKHHPDRAGGNTEQFQQIQEAYQILGDATKRAQYDNPQQTFEFNQGNMPPGMEDLFNSGIFGDVFGNRQQRAPTNQTIRVNAVISLLDAFNGKELVATIRLPSGTEQGITINIPSGIHHGTSIRVAGIGDDRVKTSPRGDIIATIGIDAHPAYERNGNDLVMNTTVSMWDAALGSQIHVDTIDGKTLEVTIPPGTQYGHMMAISNGGMPILNGKGMRGRLIIRVIVTIPTFLSDGQRGLLEQSKK